MTNAPGASANAGYAVLADAPGAFVMEVGFAATELRVAVLTLKRG